MSILNLTLLLILFAAGIITATTIMVAVVVFRWATREIEE